MDGMGTQSRSPVSSVTPANPAGAGTAPSLNEEMSVITPRSAARPGALDKQGMEGIKIPTFIQNKKQEG